MAFKMLERNTSVFFEEDVKECGLKLTEVTVFSGLCTELPIAASDGRRTFCFIHFTVQVKLFSVSQSSILESCFHIHLQKGGGISVLVLNLSLTSVGTSRVL